MPHDETAATAAGLHRVVPAGLGRLATYAVLSIPTLLLLGVALAPPVNHDAAAILHFTERWLAGDRLYVDLVDINPPMVFLLSTVPVLVAALLPVGTIAAFQASILLLAGLSLWLCWRVEAEGAVRDDVRPWVLGVLLPFLVLGFPIEMFGQREHLMMIAALPYLLLAAQRAGGGASTGRLEAGVALLAAVMFALKPYFLILPLLVEAQLLRTLGPRRYLNSITPWLMGIVWAGYGLVTVVWFGAYLSLVVPFAVGVYARLDTSLLGAALGAYGLGPLIGLVALVPLALMREASVLSRLVALAAIGGWLAGVLQGKGWPYHMLPAEGLVLLLAALLAADMGPRAIDGGRAGPVLAWLALALGLVTVTASREPVANRMAFARDDIAVLSSFLAREAPARPVLVLSAALNPFYPALNYSGATTGSRFMTMWMLQGVYATCPKNGRYYTRMREMSRAERYVFRAVTADLVDRRPKLIIIDELTGINPCQGKAFDLLAYFLRNPLFATAFTKYESIGSPIARLRVFRRRD